MQLGSGYFHELRESNREREKDKEREREILRALLYEETWFHELKTNTYGHYLQRQLARRGGREQGLRVCVPCAPGYLSALCRVLFYCRGLCLSSRGRGCGLGPQQLSQMPPNQEKQKEAKAVTGCLGFEKKKKEDNIKPFIFRFSPACSLSPLCQKAFSRPRHTAPLPSRNHGGHFVVRSSYPQRATRKKAVPKPCLPACLLNFLPACLRASLLSCLLPSPEHGSIGCHSRRLASPYP